LLWVGVFAGVDATASLAKPRDERVVMMNYDPNSPLWTSGTIAIESKKTGERAIVLSFQLARGEQRLASMTISGPRWSLDLSRLVTDLVSPFPTRTLITPFKVEKGVMKDLNVSIPFSIGVNNCSELDIEIVDGRVTTVEKSMAAPETRCMQ